MLATTSPFSLILFGASGNLAKLKIYPALYTLALKKRLPPKYAIVGFARSEMNDDEFRTLIADAVRADMQGEVNHDVLEEFLTHAHYHHGQYDSLEDFRSLEDRLEDLEQGWDELVRLAYLSVPPGVMPAILENLKVSNVQRAGKQFRCVLEKPVGHDLRSFEEIRKVLLQFLKEEEIYLLDHYLGKEAVRNVYFLRFANPILERLFKNSLIRHVELTAAEPLGIQERAGYFEHTGTFRDMFQSHLLEIASLLTMQIRDAEEHTRESRMHALQQFYLPPVAHLDDLVIQGQYTKGTMGKKDVVGYREEEGVRPDSRTNTYAALKLQNREARWQGVPFYLRSGKRLHKKETRISIQFHEPHAVGKGSSPNRLDIILQGEAGMKIFLQTKIGGTEPAFRPLILEDPLVCMGDCLPEHAILVLEAINGNQTWFLTFDEVRSAWRLVDPVQAHLDKPDTQLHEYAAGTVGPEAADRWIERDGVYWF